VPTKPTTIDEYLAAVRPDQRAALQRLRKAIRAAAPKAEECISYGLAAFRLDGEPLVVLGATESHCAFYPMSSSTVDAFRDDLDGYETSKGTIRFSVDRPLRAALVRKLVKARIAENASLKGAGYERAKARQKPKTTRTDTFVEEFLRVLDHPLRAEIEAVRRTILGASPAIGEGIKWNAPSFRTTEFFATIHLRSTDQLQLVLHRGAKVRSDAGTFKIPDPAGLLKWLGKDRCLVTLGAGKEFRARQAALTALIRQWIRHV
jgi:uncharacterized protein YdhG (YjbR/CyaY superfamily)